jgi:hypothetical protein
MGKEKLSGLARLLRDMADDELAAEIEQPQRLRLHCDMVGDKVIEIAFWPHDPVNRKARIVIVGLTAGRQQMRNAWMEMRHHLTAGRSEAAAAASAKTFASFSGPMRTNLVAMLDYIGVDRFLGLQSTASLWHDDVRLVHFTSVLRRPVFVDGENYSGSPPILSTPLLRHELITGFAADAANLRQAVFVPLGPVASDAVEFVAEAARLDPNRVLTGLPHPSGANAERIAFFLGRKPRSALSSKVQPERLIAARSELKTKVAKLCKQR